MASRQASTSPPVERSMTVSAPQRSAQRSFSTSELVSPATGEAPMLALIFVRAARPTPMASSPYERCTRLAGMIIRPSATSTRTCSAVRCGSRSATRRISGVTVPRRACSSCVTGTKPAGATARSPALVHPAGRKSQAVLWLGAGIPGVSGDEYASGPPTLGALANEPGFVPSRRLDGLWAPRRGRVRSVIARLPT